MSRLAIVLFASTAWMAQAEPRMRVAHIGLELDGSWSWLKEVSSIASAELIAVAEGNAELLARARATLPASTRFYAAYTEMLDAARPAAVTVTVPNSRHLEVVRECAKRRIHVWFQKPMAANAAQAREMARLAKDAGITLMINYHPIWSAPMRAVQAKLDAGAIGEIRHLEVRHAFSKSKTLSPTYEKQFLDPLLHGGGALMDQGTYGIDYAIFLLGRPVRVFATAKTLRPRAGLRMEDEAWVVMDYPRATAVIQGGWWSEPDGPGVGYTRIVGERGEIRRDLSQVTFSAANAQPEAAPLPAVAPDQRGGIAHFLDCIRQHKPVHAPHSAELNVIVNEVVDAAYESIRTGRAVPLSAR